MNKVWKADRRHWVLARNAWILLLFLPAAAHAQPASPPPAPTTDKAAVSAPETPVDPAEQGIAKKEALVFFKEGRTLYKKGQWSTALLQYEASFRLYRSWEAKTSIGACLIKLQRYDEALDAFESALREFGDKLPAKTKSAALEQVDLTRKETGAAVITGAPQGSLVFVDGRLRGEHPLAAPSSTLGGRHFIRVYKEGFVVFEKDVDIAKGGMQTIEVKLEALAQSGVLKVGEVGGQKLEVVVDGVAVGTTPWEGPVSPGPHSVALRPISVVDDPRSGSCGVPDGKPSPAAAENTTDTSELGTEPKTVVVKEGATTTLDLKAEPLDSVVRIMPDPPDAEVYVDGVFVGRGPYVGRAKHGKHVVKTQAEGYFPITQEVEAVAGSEAIPSVDLRKDLNSPRWLEHGRFVVEVRGGVALAPTFGGDAAKGCGAECQQSLGTGGQAALRVGYEKANGLGFGLSLGFLQMDQKRLNSTTKICTEDPGTCYNLPSTAPQWQNASSNDLTHIETVSLGAYGSYRVGQRFPLRLGLGAGVLLGNMDYSRTVIFDNTAAGPLNQTGFFKWIYVEPQAQIGVKITDKLSLGLSLSAMVLIAPSVPLWTQKMLINTHGDATDKLATFEKEKLTGATFFTMTQGLYVQYGF